MQIDGVPEHDSGGEQVQTAGAVTLLLEAAVADFTEAVEKHSAGQGIAGFAFIVPVLALPGSRRFDDLWFGPLSLIFAD